MVKDGVLKPIQGLQSVVFRLQPGLKVKDPMVDKENRPGGRGCVWAAEETDGSTPDDQLQREKTDAMRHMEAYAQMTKGAVPLLQNASEPLPETPSKKRRRAEEITASDTSSSFDPISPQRYPNSTPRRPMKRRCTPLSEPRRQSAPTRLLDSPVRTGLWKPMQRFEDEPIALKQEKQNSSPAWLMSALDSIRPKYPDHAFGSEKDRAKCFDCDGRTFSLGPHRAISNFERHLNSKQHRANVAARTAKCDPLNMFMPTGSMSFAFQPPEPLTVFAHRGHPTLKEARNQYLQALENEAHENSIRMSCVEYRVSASEKRNNDQIDQLSGSFEALDRRNIEQIQELNESFATAQESNNSQIREMTGRADGYERRAADRFHDVEESVSRFNETTKDFKTTIEVFEEKIDNKVSNMSGKLARSDQRNMDQMEEMAERLGKSERKVRIHADRVDNLSSKLKDMEHLVDKIKELEEVNEKQTEYIHDLESQFQTHADELQRHRQSEEALRRETSDRIEANFKHNAARFLLLESEAKQRMKTMEDWNMERFLALEKETADKIKAMEKETTKRIRALEAINKEQSERLERFESIVPILIQDGKDIREYVEESLAARRLVSQAVSRRASVNCRPTARHIPRRTSAASFR